MKLTVFGASGGTGRAVVNQALEMGYTVAAFVRDAAKSGVSHDRLRVVTGDAADLARVEEAVVGSEAVISVLGQTRTSSKTAMRVGAANIVAAMKKHRVRRLIWLTGAGVHDVGDAPSAIRAVMVSLMKLLSPGILEDSERAFETIKASSLDWTVVRVPMLKNGPKQGGYRAGFAPPPPKPLSREDVAEFLLKQLSDPSFLGKAPMIGY